MSSQSAADHGRKTTTLLVYVLAVLCCVLMSACSSSKHSTLRVRVVTDAVPGAEFIVVETALLRTLSEGIETPQYREFAAVRDAAFARGVVTAEYDGLASGEWTVRVRLRAPDGTLWVERRSIIVLDADTTITVPLSRACRDVMCPNDTGSANATECIAGICVDPRCIPALPATHEFCLGLVFCENSQNCPQLASCSETLCVDSICVATALSSGPNVCESEQWCDPTQGCMSWPGADGGVAILDASVDMMRPLDADSSTDFGDPTVDASDAAVDTLDDDAATRDAFADVAPLPLADIDAGIDAAERDPSDALDAADALDATDASDTLDARRDLAAESDAFHDSSTTPSDATELDGEVQSDLLDATTADVAQDASLPIPPSCAVDNGGCDPLSVCTDVLGGVVCGACPTGYYGDGSTGCTDVDECEENVDHCDLLVECTNTAGSYTCGDCPTGYAGGGLSGCIDIDECMAGGCSVLVSCTNEPGSFSCSACPSGYTGDGTTCTNVDECAALEPPCDALVSCNDVDGSYECGDCPSGYSGSGDSECQDIDECATNNGDCDSRVTCTNIAGSRTCGACPSPLTHDLSVTGCACPSGQVLSGTSCIAQGTAPVQTAYVKASNTGAGDWFGYSVAFSGDGNTLAIGAHSEDGSAVGINGVSNDSSTDSGAVYVYSRRDASWPWTQQAYVKPSNTGSGDSFGVSVALSYDGNTLAVGAWREDGSSVGVNGTDNNGATDAGAVYVFTRTSGTWSQQAYIKSSNAGTLDFFGYTVVLSDDGDTLAASAHGEDGSGTGVNPTNNNSATDAGAVYVFMRSSGTWSQQAYVKASNTGGSDEFGGYDIDLSADGNTLAVGAHNEDGSTSGINGTDNNGASNAGAAYVFTRASGAWSQQAYVKASNPGNNDQFGYSLELSGDGDTLAVASRFEDSDGTGVGSVQTNNNATDSGAVYVFTRASSAWSQQAYIKSSNSASGDNFGVNLALDGDGNTLAVGAWYEDSSTTGINSTSNDDAMNSGAVYSFHRVSSSWTQTAYIKASNTGASDWFGTACAFSADGSMLAVAALTEASNATGIGGAQGNDSAAGAGAVYLFSMP